MHVGRKWNAILIIAVFGLATCAIGFASTIAVCRFRADHSAFSVDMTISEFLGRQNYTTYDLIRQSEQAIDSYAVIWGQASRGAWSHGTYRCSNGECELQRLTLEISLRSVFACWPDESGKTLGFTEFRFDIPQNRVQADTGWFDRPIMQDTWVRLSSVSPTIDEVVLSVLQPRQDLFPTGEDVIVDVYADRDYWNVRVQRTSATKEFEFNMPFHQPGS